jgi:hypothetical protein
MRANRGLRSDIAQLLDDLGEIFGNHLSPRAAELYFDALGDLSRAEVAAAGRALMRDHERYFPSPAEIRAAAARDPDGEEDFYPALPPPPLLSPEDQIEKNRLAAEMRDWITEQRLGVLDEHWFARADLAEVKRVFDRWRKVPVSS